MLKHAIYCQKRQVLQNKLSVAKMQSKQKNVASNLSKSCEMCDSLSSFRKHIVLAYLQPFHRNSPLKCAPQRKLQKKH